MVCEPGVLAFPKVIEEPEPNVDVPGSKYKDAKAALVCCLTIIKLASLTCVNSLPAFKISKIPLDPSGASTSPKITELFASN